jgi:hypothetical protein
MEALLCCLTSEKISFRVACILADYVGGRNTLAYELSYLHLLHSIQYILYIHTVHTQRYSRNCMRSLNQLSGNGWQLLINNPRWFIS